MKNYLSKWGFLRAIRLALSIVIIVQGVQDRQWLLAVMGGFFALMALLNFGCNGAASCATPRSRSTKRVEDAPYQEVK